MAATLQERGTYLEGRLEEPSRLGAELREMVFHLDQKVDRLRKELFAQLQALDPRLLAETRAVDQNVDRFREELTAQMQGLDQRLSARVQSLEQKVQDLDQRMTRYFIWLMGLQFATLATIISILLLISVFYYVYCLISSLSRCSTEPRG
ncbi:MAG: hypothetical protein NZ742_05855 [Acidobacteria bacterium]|nr:hypothetical protein [Acidobacteriota bacterium]MDW7984402.1 hypothetical protein [Acidobacteriota bacterium]